MKLLHYTYKNLSLLLFLLLGIWGIFFYYTILEEVTDETDDSLENYREILVNSALQDSTVLDTSGNVMSMYSFRLIPKAEAVIYKESFFDSTIYIQSEDEYEPVRVMKSCFMMPDGKYYELEIMISTLEREDMIEAIGMYLLILYFVLLICIIVGNHFILKRAFKPLDKLMNWLDRIQPGKQVPALDNDTNIQEFKRLNEAALAMGNRSYRAYLEQKQFIENASHELQTPLAIVRGKVELLAENESLTEDQMKELDDIYTTLGRAVKLNKSLLLLSRIENQQYVETDKMILNDVVEKLLPDLLAVYEAKGIEFVYNDKGKFVFSGNSSLVQILVSNLLKNALVHNQFKGKLSVEIDENTFVTRNSGTEPLDKEKIFQRFYHSQQEKKDSTGLGLSIAKSIVKSCNLYLSYSWEEGMHCFTLSKKK